MVCSIGFIHVQKIEDWFWFNMAWGGGGVIHVRDLFLKIVFENQIFHAQVRNSGTVTVLYSSI